MKHQKQIIRRTFLQERFEILVKKQQKGKATFADLTELDDIVNRDPEIRYSILEEIQGSDTPPPSDDPKPLIIHIKKEKAQSLAEKIKEFIGRLFAFTSLNIRLVH